LELAVVVSMLDRSATLREEARIKRLAGEAKLRLIEAFMAGHVEPFGDHRRIVLNDRSVAAT